MKAIEYKDTPGLKRVSTKDNPELKKRILSKLFKPVQVENNRKNIEKAKKSVHIALLQFLDRKNWYYTVYSQNKNKQPHPQLPPPQPIPEPTDTAHMPVIRKVLVRTKSYSFDMAVRKWLYKKKNEEGNFNWHLGISSEVIPMFDIDEVIAEEKATEFAKKLQKYILKNCSIENRVIILRTQNGYHVVSDAELSEDQWLKLNQLLYNRINERDETLPPLDREHLRLNIKYKSTTLRISPKYDKEIYKFIGVI